MEPATAGFLIFNALFLLLNAIVERRKKVVCFCYPPCDQNLELYRTQKL